MCLLCKDGNMEDFSQFLFACPKLEDEWCTFWYILRQKFQVLITFKNILLHFIENLDKPTIARLLLGGLSLPFNSRIADFINKFVAVSIQKIYKIRQNMIRQVRSSWWKFDVVLTFFSLLLYFFYVRNEMFEIKWWWLAGPVYHMKRTSLFIHLTDQNLL